MAVFTISQVQPGKEIYLYPTGDGCVTDLNPHGQATNWECVDEVKNYPNDDTDYVYSDVTSIVRDLYTTDETELSGLSGTINYVQIYARGKSTLYPQHKDGIYKIILTTNPSECTDGVIYKSNDKNLVTSYNNFFYVWNTNPSTATDWEWDDFDDFEMGVEVSSPTLTDYLVSLTLRPNAAGDKTELHPWSKSVPHTPANYTCVDDSTSDGDDTTVETARTLDFGAAKSDLYNVPNHTTEVGTIQSVTVFYRIQGWEDQEGEAAGGIKIGGSEYWETLHDTGTPYQWILYSYTWTENPNTSSAWTWANIDDLQIGVKLKTDVGSVYCTQVYAVVKYYAAVNPEIRTTQVYAKINYDSEVTCTLNKPKHVSVDHDRNIKMLNFWSGDRAVYDIGRNHKTMVITGTEYGSDACEKIECVKGVAKYGGDITTNGLGGRFDSTFKILSVGWQKITDKPLTFDWIIELEYSNLGE